MGLNTDWIPCGCVSDSFGFMATQENLVGPQPDETGRVIGSLHNCPNCHSTKFCPGDPARLLSAPIPTPPSPMLRVLGNDPSKNIYPEEE